jgi:hypothetical protein
LEDLNGEHFSVSIEADDEERHGESPPMHPAGAQENQLWSTANTAQPLVGGDGHSHR